MRFFRLMFVAFRGRVGSEVYFLRCFFWHFVFDGLRTRNASWLYEVFPTSVS